MFGKPEWFVPKKFGWGLRPVTKEGWIYTGAWVAVLCLPFVILIMTTGWVEAVIWMVAMMAFLVIDVELIIREMERQKAEK